MNHAPAPKRSKSGTAVPTEKVATVHSPEEREWVQTYPGERVAILVHSGSVGGQLSVLEAIAAPCAASPMHYHREDEILQILEGVLTFSCEGKVFDALAGTTIVVPAGAHHAWINHAPSPVRMLVTFSPGGIEELFKQLHRTSHDKLDTLAAEYGTHVVGPGIVG